MVRNTLPILGALLAVTLLLAPTSALADKKPCGEDADLCVTKMLEKIRQKGWIGIELDWPEEGGPPTVTRVLPDSPAEAAGLAAGDVLLAMNGLAYSDENAKQVKKAYYKLVPGDTLVYTVGRGGSEREVEVLLAHVPDAVAAQWIGNHVIQHHAHAEEGTETEIAGKND
jgi:predicted metalloprotease with PDZ domain